jgi:hypothetical protein
MLSRGSRAPRGPQGRQGFIPASRIPRETSVRPREEERAVPTKKKESHSDEFPTLRDDGKGSTAVNCTEYLRLAAEFVASDSKGFQGIYNAFTSTPSAITAIQDDPPVPADAAGQSVQAKVSLALHIKLCERLARERVDQAAYERTMFNKLRSNADIRK